MKVCIVGAGAIGGLVATRLAVAGKAHVSAIARGATLDSLKAHGWQLSHARGESRAPARVTSDPHDLGEQELVVLAVKAPALGEVAKAIAPLIGPHTVVMPAMNGVPWWFVANIPALAGEPLQSIELLAKKFGDDMLVGAGTVLDPTDVGAVWDAGGRIIVRPIPTST